MGLRANFQKSYLWRYFLVAGVCLAFSAWFAYDGLIGYPLKLEMAKEYEGLARSLEGEALREAWRQKVSEKNWPRVTPNDKSEHISEAIPQQYFWCGLTALIGLPALYFFLTSRFQWVERTETGIVTSWGQTFDFSATTRLDKSKWEKKGIAKATYQEEGRLRTFVFDDFKFDREPLDQMVRELEQQLSDEQITGGTREPVPNQGDSLDASSNR